MEANSNEALREALADILDKIDKWRTDGTMEHWQYSQLFDIVDAGLAIPRRNCDVGTAAEQYARWRAFCDTQELCRECKVYRTADACASKSRCNLTWAQMPYEILVPDQTVTEGGAK